MTNTENEVQENTTVEEQNKNLNISIEQVLASVVKTYGKLVVKVEDLVADYGSKQIAVNQNEDGSVTFELTDLPQVEESVAEEKAE
jgi:Flp pilus assembly CpaF family ATPase